MYFSRIPVRLHGAPVDAWIRLSTQDALRIAACTCGARIEERVRTVKPLRGGRDLQRFVGDVLSNSGAVTAFASAHVACTATIHGPTACRETFWGVPSSVPASVRFWADEVLERTLADGTGDRRVTVVVSVLVVDASGQEQAYSREVPSHWMPNDVNVNLWIRATLTGLIGECPGQLVGAMLVARESNVGQEGGKSPSFAIIATPRTRFNGLLTFEPSCAADGAAEWREYDWQPGLIPNDIFDGLFV